MSSFLAALANRVGGPFLLRNERTGTIVADRLIPALDSASRRTGLLKHAGLLPGQAMVIAPSNAVHTFFMRFTIDVVFVDKQGQVVKVCAGVKPWRLAWAWGAYAVIEGAEGALARTSARGDRLCVVSDEAEGYSHP